VIAAKLIECIQSQSRQVLQVTHWSCGWWKGFQADINQNEIQGRVHHPYIPGSIRLHTNKNAGADTCESQFFLKPLHDCF
jgi:hypothetical protein